MRSPGEKPGYSRPSSAIDDAEAVFSFPMFLDLEAEQSEFTGVAAHYAFLAQITDDTETTGGRAMLVSGRYFDVLGLGPAAGRLIGPQDTPRVGESDVAVLSYEYWQSRFGGDAAVVGETLTVNNRALDDRRRRAGGIRRHAHGLPAAALRAADAPLGDAAGDAARRGQPPGVLALRVRALAARHRCRGGHGHRQPALRRHSRGSRGAAADRCQRQRARAILEQTDRARAGRARTESAGESGGRFRRR